MVYLMILSWQGIIVACAKIILRAFTMYIHAVVGGLSLVIGLRLSL